MEATATATQPHGRRPIEVGRVIREVFELYAAHAVPLLVSAFAIFFIVSFLGAFADSVLVQFLFAIISLIATTLYAGFVVKLVEDVRDGRRDFTVGELFSSASKYIFPLIVNGFLKGVAVLIGFVLLIIPGLYLLTIWAVTSPAIVAEEKGSVAAFGRSNELVDGQKMAVFLTILTAFLITIGIGLVAATIGEGIGDGARFALSLFASTVTAPIVGLAAAVIFFDLGGGAAEPPDDAQAVVEY